MVTGRTLHVGRGADGTDAWHVGRGVHKASCVPRHEEQGLMCERVLKIRYRDDFLSESFHGNGSIS